MEIWKDINGYEGFYQISNEGKVKSLITGKLLIGDVNNIGYRRVCLYKPKRKRFFVHRLVATYFVPGQEDGFVVNHKDGNKLNNNADNLEWVTRSENDIHAYKMNLRTPHPCLFKHKIECFDLFSGNRVHIYENAEECAKSLHVQRPNIYATCNGKQKSCKGYGLRYI